MKNKIILIFFLLLQIKLNAQKNNFGFTIGLNYSDYISNNIGKYYETSSQPSGGLLIGTFVNQTLSKKVVIQTGINYVVKNSRYVIYAAKSIDPSVEGFPIGDTRRGYIQIPINFIYTKNKHWGYYGGVFMGTVCSNFKNPKPEYFGLYRDQEIYPVYKKWDNGLHCGISLRLNK